MRPLSIIGHFGIGDNLYQRAIIRELEKQRPLNCVWLHTCHYDLYHDFISRDLNLALRPTRLRAQKRTVQRERHRFATMPPQPANAEWRQISYPAAEIARKGSILAAMFNHVGVAMPDKPDFRLPLKDEWRREAKKLIASWDMRGKPLLIFRPPVVRREWIATQSRNPDTRCYGAIFETICRRFFTVSVANLSHGEEWIDGGHLSKFGLCDVLLHGGIDDPVMWALWAEADLVLTPSGFGFVLAQAVGTPVIAVFGGMESSRTTLVSGMHLAPSLGIDPDGPCDCHKPRHRCTLFKHITLSPALEKVEHFIEQSVDFRNDLHQRRFQGEDAAALAGLPS